MLDRAGRVAAFVATMLFAQLVLAQTDVRWKAAVDGEWNDVDNWDPAVVPNNDGADTFNVIIDVTGGPYTIDLDIDVTIDSLQLVSDDATLTGAAGGTILVLNSVQLTNAALVDITDFGSLGTFVFDSTVCDDLCDILLSHDGTSMTWTGTGNILLQGDPLGGTQLIHGAGSTFEILNAQMLTADAESLFQNLGTILKSSLGITTFTGGELQNQGTLDVEAGSFETDSVMLPAGTLTQGTWIVRDNAELALKGTPIINNEATVTLSGPNSIFTSFDTVEVNASTGSFSILDGRFFSATRSLLNQGQLFVGVGSTLFIPFGSSLDNIGGQIRGSGTIINRVVNSGVVAPGASPGVLTVLLKDPEQSFVQDEAGIVEIELGGNLPGIEYDQLQIQGRIEFMPPPMAGTLIATLINSFVPLPGDTFDVIFYSEIVGQFQQILTPNLPCNLEIVPFYQPDRLQLVVVETCIADCTKDGVLNILDFVCFQGEWINQTPCGDCDGNEQFNILDFVCFQGEFVMGCP
jgi:hypothetical protein